MNHVESSKPLLNPSSRNSGSTPIVNYDTSDNEFLSIPFDAMSMRRLRAVPAWRRKFSSGDEFKASLLVPIEALRHEWSTAMLGCN
ncbi:MAG: hypothetical protein EXQ52_00400 [Bryobacterales bacterium]|nr:hypothetical protein [Bryobacterales bacterium]